jgi:hypothetical protein
MCTCLGKTSGPGLALLRSFPIVSTTTRCFTGLHCAHYTELNWQGVHDSPVKANLSFAVLQYGQKKSTPIRKKLKCWCMIFLWHSNGSLPFCFVGTIGRTPLLQREQPLRMHSQQLTLRRDAPSCRSVRVQATGNNKPEGEESTPVSVPISYPKARQSSVYHFGCK